MCRCHFEVTAQWKQVLRLSERQEQRDGCLVMTDPCGCCENRCKTDLCYHHDLQTGKESARSSLLGTIRKNGDQEWRKTADTGVHTLSDRVHNEKKTKNKTQIWVPFRFWQKSDVKRSDSFRFISFALPMSSQLQITWVRISASLYAVLWTHIFNPQQSIIGDTIN